MTIQELVIIAINRAIKSKEIFDVSGEKWCFANAENPIEDGDFDVIVTEKGFYKRVLVQHGEYDFTWLHYPYYNADDFYKYVISKLPQKDQEIASLIGLKVPFNPRKN